MTEAELGFIRQKVIAALEAFEEKGVELRFELTVIQATERLSLTVVLRVKPEPFERATSICSELFHFHPLSRAHERLITLLKTWCSTGVFLGSAARKVSFGGFVGGGGIVEVLLLDAVYLLKIFSEAAGRKVALVSPAGGSPARPGR